MKNIHNYEFVGLEEIFNCSLNCQNMGGNICKWN